MRKPEEIKKGLACCAEASPGACEHCPYGNDCEDFGACKLPRDALDYINQLEARLASVGKTCPEWINVKDRLPKDDDDVLIFSNERVIFVGCYKNGQWISYSLYAIYGNVVTHWMPLPSTEGLK